MRIIRFVLEIIFFPILICVCVVSRLVKSPIDIGLGPDPLINNVYHKLALTAKGYRAETFVDSVYFITSEFDRIIMSVNPLINLFVPYYIFIFSIFRYNAIYMYFNGGPLRNAIFLWKLEPYLYKLSCTKTLIMPYGGDIQDLMRCPNLLFRDTMSKSYPRHRFARNRIANRVDLWTCRSDHVVSGCDWVDYMYYWDTLMLAHFSIDTRKWKPNSTKVTDSNEKTLKILHAPNHREIKGTKYFINAVDQLRSEDVDVELIIVEKVSNEEIRRLIQQVDLVADQLIIGWYAMFALEAMSMGKPVLCYLRSDLEQLYIDAGLLEKGELPIINCSVSSVKDEIRSIAENKAQLEALGEKSREFVLNHHSLDVVGKIFDNINRSINIFPSLSPQNAGGCEKREAV